MKHMLKGLLGVALLSSAAQAELNVMACEPEWAALAVEIGGDNVNVYSATTHLQDAHKVQARPSLIARARSADVLLCSGAELEIGWLPVLLRKSGNGRIQPGQPGHIIAAEHVNVLGKLDNVDRSMGDVHPEGNPHIAVDPRRLVQVGAVLSQRLSALDATNAAAYQQRYQQFAASIEAALLKWQPRVAKLNGTGIVAYHDSWLYLEDWLGLRKLATIEPIPGVPPSASHLARLLTQLRQQPPAIIIYSPYEDSRPSDWLSKKIDRPAQVIPLNPEQWREPGALIQWYDAILSKLGA